MMKYFSLILFVLFFHGSYAQYPFHFLYPDSSFFSDFIEITNMTATHDNGLASVDFAFNQGSIHVMKFDSIGQNEWRKEFFIPQCIVYPGDIIELSNHDLMICGSFSSGPLSLYFLLRTDSNGNIIYFKTDNDSLMVESGKGIIHFAGLTPDGKVILAGIGYTLPNGSGFLTKIDSTGIVDWTVSFRAETNTDFTSLRSKLMTDGSIVVSGFGILPQGTQHFGIMKFDSTANLIWSMHSPVSINFGIVSPPIELDNSYYTLASQDTPTTNNNVPHLYKVSTINGDLVWHTQYNDFISGSSYQNNPFTHDGEIITSGRRDSINVNPVMIEIDSTGIANRGHFYYAAAPTFIQLNNSVETFSGNPVLYGMATDYLTNLSGYLLMSVDSSYQLECYRSPFSLNPPAFYQDTLIPSGNSFLSSGALKDITPFLQSISDVIPELDFCNIVGMADFHSEKTLSIFPNPAQDQFTVFSPQFAIQSIEIFNTLGERVYKSETNCESCIVHCESFPADIYVVKAFSDDKVFVRKLIRQ